MTTFGRVWVAAIVEKMMKTYLIGLWT